MALSMSVSAGAHNERHNTDLEYRATLKNVDPKLSYLNKVLANEGIRKAYDRRFGEAVKTYNAKQISKGHPERTIENYYEKIRDAYKADQAKVKSGNKGRSNVAKPCYEYVVQIGNHETWQTVPMETLTQIYTEAFEQIKKKTAGAIDWFQAVIHYDEPEGSGHLHIAGIPYGTGNKRGLETQVSMNQAVKTLGLEDVPAMRNFLMKELETVAHEHEIERQVMNCDHRHKNVREFKQATRDVADMVERLETKTAQVAELDARLECLRLEIEEAELQPVQETVSESLGTLWTNRGAGSREEGLRSEIEGLREQIISSEDEVEQLRSRMVELERGLPELRERHQSLGERFRAIEQRVTSIIERLREVPETLSKWALNIADKLGVRTYNPNSLNVVARESRLASHAINEPSSRENRPYWER